MAAMIDGMRAIANAEMNRYGDAGAAAGGGAPSASSIPLPQDVTRFESALHRVQAAREDRTGGPGPTRPLRDALRDAAHALDRDWTAATRLATPSLRAGRWGPADMLALQGRLLQASMQMDLASKLVQKSTQAVDQLVRIQ